MDDITNIINSLTKIQERSDMFRHGREVVFDNITLAEVHCVDRIGTISYANVTKLANAMEMTRGAISKMSKKLLNKGLIGSFQRPENNKEIYFRLTGRGHEVFCEHQKCHSQAIQEKTAILETYSEYEQSVIVRFLNDINHLHDTKLADGASEEE